jgi:uncharacterized protein YdhG (YjbR/CyaY superfamily)
MQSKATTVAAYLAELPGERRAELETVLKVIRANLAEGFEEGMQYGMIGWFVPHRLYPQGYHCNPDEPLPFAHLASQKNHLALYLMCLYTDSAEMERFRQRWAATGKKLDMGKACIRFKRATELALDVIGETFARVTVEKFVEHYEAGRPRKRK